MPEFIELGKRQPASIIFTVRIGIFLVPALHLNFDFRKTSFKLENVVVLFKTERAQAQYLKFGIGGGFNWENGPSVKLEFNILLARFPEMGSYILC